MQLKTIVLASLLIGLMADPAPAGQSTGNRFYHSGDGHLHLTSRKTGQTFNGRYRDGCCRYREEAYAQICAVFDAPVPSSPDILSLRLIEFLDFLEDRMKPGARLIITSGYRPPEYNTTLREGGALAAKASLHQYGMAADLIVEGVAARRVWEYVRSIGFGGTGYYHGETVHVDVGPARFWDDQTSGVGSGLSDDNKLIGLVTDFDIYAPGDWVTLSFIRMTAFPVAVRAEFHLRPSGHAGHGDGALPFIPDVARFAAGPCSTFADIGQMAAIRWRLPTTLPPGRYTIRAAFCDSPWEAMPGAVATPAFEIRLP